MKANRNFRREDDAVSPVIGVILMVAITVVLAAVVFVLVQDLGGNQETTPSISLQKDENNDQLSVARADNDINWDEFQIRLNRTVTNDIHYALNAEADNSGTEVQETLTTMDEGQITGADYLDFCTDHATDATTDVEITIIHTASNSQVYQSTFRNIAVC